MFETLPKHYEAVQDWEWARFQAYVDDLLNRPLNSDSLDAWMLDKTRLADLLEETYNRLYTAHTIDTTDENAEKRYFRYLDDIYPRLMEASQALNQKLADSGLVPQNFEVPLRGIRAALELYREENLPLLVQQEKLGSEYDKIIGAQTVEWEGEEKTLPQLQPLAMDTRRDLREKAWRLETQRTLQDREAINALWVQLLELRQQLARNADKPDFRAYQWQAFGRFDYTPEDCESFHQAIEAVVVPAVQRLNDYRRQQLGLDSLRPWDLDVDLRQQPALKPFEEASELISKASQIFHKVDPVLGGYFDDMQAKNLLDLENRKGKAPGGYCTSFAVERIPFIFMNAVGVHDDVQTLLHEGGHAFHVYEARVNPYNEQNGYPTEFAEVASMSMELLAAPYLAASEGGYYTEAEAARARMAHIASSLRFWPYMAVVDAFQHWVYSNVEAAKNAANCDAKWSELWDRFMPGVDWSGLEEEKATGWHRKLHIFVIPFYYVEYGLAQLGAWQVWANAVQDQGAAVARYRQALALGGTATLPDLFQAAGARFAFDADTLKSAVDLMERSYYELAAQG